MTATKTLAQLSTIIGNAGTDLFVRWSRGVRLDRKQGCSRDYVAGQNHCGLSAVPVDSTWAQDHARLARRVTEYRFLRMKDPRIGCHVYRATRIGTDSDGYALITEVQHVATLAETLITQLVLLKK